ncbi:MAG: hypothetical protein C0596_18185 [Marinilabiliales bacterium]|nr:MAG: hypothetical protein C0596_18185 [Marinilabiliales bacterium]
MKKILLISLVLISSIFAIADNVKFTARSTSKAGVGQNFQVQYTLNEKPSEIQLGDYSGLKLINGPSISTSSNVQIINGQYSQENTYTYTYIFQASKTGTYTIEGATAKIGSKSYTSNSVNVEIQQDPVQTNNGINNRRNNYDPWADFYNMMGYDNNANAQPKEITNEDLFVRVFVDKTNLFKGEHLIATVKIYSKVDLVGFEDIKLPQFDDFYVEEIETPDRINLVRENYNNDVYNVGLVKKYILYPRISGDLTIESCQIDCQIRQPIQSNGYMSVFGYYETISKSIKSPEIGIKVNQLPQSPESFTGAVGKFSMSVNMSEDTVLVNDAVSIKVSISGNGNFNMIETHSISWPKEFEVYEPVAEQNVKTDASGLNGTKTWEYTIIPRYPGIFKLGKFSFTYFDTNSKQYKTVNSDNISIAVKKDANDTDFGETYNYTQKNLDYISEDDIRFVNYDDLNLKQNYIPLPKKGFFIWMFVLPTLIFIVLVVILRKKIRENANLALVKQRKAGKTSQKRLKKARKFMKQNSKTEFYKEIISALWGYCGYKLEIPVAELTKDNIKDIMISKNVKEDLINNLLEIIDKCEFAHFAPSVAEYELNNIYMEATEIIESLEQTIK